MVFVDDDDANYDDDDANDDDDSYDDNDNDDDANDDHICDDDGDCDDYDKSSPKEGFTALTNISVKMFAAGLVSADCTRGLHHHTHHIALSSKLPENCNKD